GGQSDIAMLETSAVDLDRAVLAPKERNVLIHDAAGHAHELSLGALAKTREPQRLQSAAVEIRQRRGYFEGSRGTESRALGHRAADQQVGRFDSEPGPQQFLRNTHRIV